MVDKLKHLDKRFILMLLFVIGLFSCVCFINISKDSVYLWDESRHAISAYEMIKNHNYLINTYMGEPDYWNLKPILSFWYLIPSYKIFGFTEFATRFPSIICGYIVLVILMVYVYRHYNKKYAVFAGLLFSCCYFLFFNHGIRCGDPEAVYLLFFVSAMVCLLESKNNKYLYIPYFFFASLAFLTKSFHALIILFIGLIYYLTAGDFKKLKWYIYPLSILALVVLPSIWIYERYKFDGAKFFNAMFDDLFNRGSKAIEGNTGTIFYYFGSVTSSFAFWFSVFLFIYISIRVIKIKGLKQSFKTLLDKFKKTIFNQTHLEAKLIFIWVFSVFLFYSLIIKTKLQWYIMSIYFPLIILTIELIKFIINKNLVLKKREHNNYVCIATIGISIVYTIVLASAGPYIKSYDNGQVNHIKPIVTSTEISRYKGKEFYYYKGNWMQNDVFYIETNNFIPKNEGYNGHKSSINSLYCIDSNQKDQYIIDNPGEVLVYSNTAYSVFYN